ncbi:hypothetical protein LJR290_007905 [Variovorax sp. LjRoot290]|uniref:hypothetical protein n=1 Tax=Variovorax sp. LjRoot290 TaxID=3342316 RepID=UPI003ECCBE9A
MSRKQPSQKKLQIEVDSFNAKVPLGGAVDYFSYEGAPLERFKTRTEAQILSGHTAVVWLEGKAGCVCVSHCLPVVGEAANGAAQ